MSVDEKGMSLDLLCLWIINVLETAGTAIGHNGFYVESVAGRRLKVVFVEDRQR